MPKGTVRDKKTRTKSKSQGAIKKAGDSKIESDLREPIWAIIFDGGSVLSDLTYAEASDKLNGRSGTLVTSQAAARFVEFGDNN